MEKDNEQQDNAPEWDADAQVGIPIQEPAREGSSGEVHEEDEAREESFYAGRISPRFTVKEITEHEDGSSTFQIDGSKEDMQLLFEAFFLQALIAGIRSTKEETERFVAECDALKAADKLVRFLDVWEIEDSFDYDPGVRAAKEELKELLKKAGV